MTNKAEFIVFAGTFVDTPKLNELRIRTKCCIGVDMRDGIRESVNKGTIVFINENSGNYNDPIKDALEYDSSLQKDKIEIVQAEVDDMGLDGLSLNEHVSQSNNSTKFFFPGFVDTHCHASQYPNAGIFGQTTLLDWLNKYTFPLEKSLQDLTIANKVYTKVIQKTLSHGTTTIAYYATIDLKSSILLAELCSQYGQRAYIGKVCMDRNSPDYYTENVQDCMDSMDTFLKYLNRILQNNKIKPIVTPRFAPSCSNEMMQRLGDLSLKGDTNCAETSHKLHVQTHLSENKEEIEWVKRLFPEIATYTHVYDHFKLLHERTVLAHCIHLSEEEADLIKLRKSGVSHCPISNSSITSGECQVRWLLDKQIKVSLGTDLSGGYSPSILDTARQALLVSRHVAMKINSERDSLEKSSFVKHDKEHYKLSSKEVLYLATMGGAQCLDMDCEIGSFAIGKQFDCQLIDLNCKNSNVDIFNWQFVQNEEIHSEHFEENKEYEKFNDLIDKWLFNGDDRNTRMVWIQGKKVVTK
ncbi:hypothetical protein ACO0QE_000947 [Hanseniaspora vineae]